MKQIVPQDNWPESWKLSHQYDRLEIHGNERKSGYSYAWQNRRRHTLALINKVARPGEKILDVAAAQGNFSLTLAELGYEVTWNDLREDLSGYVEAKREHGIVHYAPGNIFDMDFHESFDLVLIAEIIEHVAHPDAFLQKIAALVKPGGYIVMTSPNGEYFRNSLPKFSNCPDVSSFEDLQFKPDGDGHIFLFHLDEIHELSARASLSVREIRLFTNPLTAGHMKLDAALKHLPKAAIETIEHLSSSLPLPLSKKLHTAAAVLLQRSQG